MPNKIEANCTTKVESVIELTNTEMTQLEANQVAHQARQAEEDAAIKVSTDTKASAIAKLCSPTYVRLLPEEAATLVF